MNSGIILLSGGLDSFVSFDIAYKKMNIKLAIIFNYGQKAFREELSASKKIAKQYNTKLKVVSLPFLKQLSNNSLSDCSDNVFDDFNSVWIPNRNGLFLNIAACYCDKYNLDYIIIGANREEAKDFPDNSEKFIEYANKFFAFSTLKQPKVFAPCLKFDKIAIINYAIDNNMNLSLIKSCYNSSEITSKKHCGKCLSCKLLKNAIKKSKKPELLKEIF